MFPTLTEAQQELDRWVTSYNTERPRSALAMASSFSAGTWKPVSTMPSGSKTRSHNTSAIGAPPAR